MKRLSILLVLAACGDASGPTVQLLPASFQVISGADQIATVAKELPQAVEVRVLDNSAGPVPNYPINWTALDGGSVFAPVAYSGTDGIARQRWTLGTKAWTDIANDPASGRKRQRLVARALHPETGAVLVDDSVIAVARPDVAVRVSLSSNAQAVVGDSALVPVTFLDQHSNGLAHCPSGGTWGNLTWWSTDSTVAIPTGRLYWAHWEGSDRAEEMRGDSLVYGWVRGIAGGTTTIGVTANCISYSATRSFTVTQ